MLSKLEDMGQYVAQALSGLSGNNQIEVADVFGPLLDGASNDVLAADTTNFTANVYRKIGTLSLGTAGTYLVYAQLMLRRTSSSTIEWTMRLTNDDSGNTIIAQTMESGLAVAQPTQSREFMNLVTVGAAANVSVWMAPNQSTCFVAANSFNANSTANVVRATSFWSFKVDN